MRYNTVDFVKKFIKIFFIEIFDTVVKTNTTKLYW